MKKIHRFAILAVLICAALVFVLVKTALLNSSRTHAAPPAAPVAPFENTFDLRAFGAVGDGVANDGPALQNALSAIASAGGGTLVVPAGRYAIITPVSQDFSVYWPTPESLTIKGVASSTQPNPKGSGEQQSHGLDLTSEFVIKTGHPHLALALRGLKKLLISDMVFIGTPDAATDARIPLFLGGIEDATLKHCEFYGLSSINYGGAILYADNSGLSLDQTVFLGCTGNSGIHNDVVLTTNWKQLSFTDSIFIDYGQRPNYYGKTGLGSPYAWIEIGDAAPIDSLSPRRDVTFRNVFLDEGGFMGIIHNPYFFDPQSASADLIYISDLLMNVGSFNASGIYLDRAQHVLMERSRFQLSHAADNAVNLLNVGDAILDRLECLASADRIRANSGIGHLTVINSIYNHLDSLAQVTQVLTFPNPDDDPAQFVRHQYLGVLGLEPDGAGHYNWSSLLLACGTDQTCLAQRRAELTAFLNIPKAPSLLRYDGQFLFWQDNSVNETGFKIERTDPATGVWTQLSTAGANVTSRKVTTNPIVNQHWRVRAYNSSGNSAYTNEVWVSEIGLNGAEPEPEPLFSDNFNDNSIDASKWTVNYPQGTPAVTEQSQHLQFTLAPNTAGYNGVSSNSTYDFTSRMVQVEVIQPVSMGGSCENFLQAILDANNYYSISVGGGSMVLRSMVGGGNNQTVINYDPAVHHYWRIRHDQSANMMNFETSADYQTWTIQKTVATAFPVSGLRFTLGAGAWSTGNGSPGEAKFDNFQVVAGTTGTASRIPNYGFEIPAVGYSAFQYGPTGGSWSFIGGSGVTGNGSGFTGALATAPEGNQAAFLQGNSIISQPVSGFAANRTYIITFAAAQRSNCCNTGGQDFQVYVDNSLVGTFHPATGGYAYYSTPVFTTTTGAHTLKFVGLNSLGGDHTAFIDNVRVTASAGW